MSLKIRVYSDFVCPFCFLAKTPFEEAIQGKDVEVEWMPFELRPSPSPKLDPWNDPSKLQGWESYIRPAASRLGIEMKLPRISPHPYTGLAFEGFHFAKEHGKGNEYTSRVLKAFFQEELHIGEVDVLTKLAGELGLPQEAFRAALETGAYRQTQREALAHAYEEAGITAVPTFIIGSERIQGVAGRDVFERVLAQELQAAEAAPVEGLQCDVNGNGC
ncbi:DsbA family oxidoreductase [Paenibacillus sp. y28]|uniref:DsbA family oxidoreductase n=1 Tax=Paenibacillus sp. y28 TaxID=3129110 RepID=UPI00301ABB53